MVIKICGIEIACDKAIKSINENGIGKVEVFDENGNIIATASGISDFTGYEYYDDQGELINL